MNILVVNWQDWHNPFTGGAEVYLYEIFSRLIKKNHRIMLLCSRAKNQRRFEILDGFEIYRIGRRTNFNFLAPFALKALLRHKLIDVVVDDLNKIPFFSSLFTRKKVYAMLMHVFRQTIYKETNPLAASYVYCAESLVPWLYNNRAGFIAISNSSAVDLRAMGVRGKIHVVQSGIPRIPAGIKEGRKKDLVVYVGRIKRYKSIDHFIKAVKLLEGRRNLKAMIVGDGDAMNELKALAREIKANIEFTGFVSEEEKFRIYSRARAVVQPSIKEGWGLTAIEAQACGTPVVCADSPGLREVVANGETGFLYPYGNIEKLAARITELLDNDDIWASFSCAAVKWTSTFSWDNAARKMEKILTESIS